MRSAYVAICAGEGRCVPRRGRALAETAFVYHGIRGHHKITPFRGPHRDVVEACRKADWIDANKGLIRNGLAAAQIRADLPELPP